MRGVLPGIGLVAAGCAAGADGPAPGAPLLVAAPPVVVGPGSGQVTFGDVDRDGRLDLVTRHLLARRVVVRFGDGRGGFGGARRDAVTTLDAEPGSTDLGDLDGDGALDLVVAARHAGREVVLVLRGAGDGTFAPAGAPVAIRPEAPGYKPTVRLTDVDCDGRLDALAANGRRGTIEVLAGDGRGGLGPPRGVQVGRDGGLLSFAVADLDADGDADLVVADDGGDLAGPGAVRTFLGDGGGGFAPGASVPVAPRPFVESAGDVDGDGRADVVVSHREAERVSVLLRRADGTFAAPRVVRTAPGAEVYDAVVADVDADGRADLVLATVAARAAPFASSVAVLLGAADGSFRPAPGSPFAAGDGAYDVAVGDVDGDGRPDVAASSFEGDAVTLLLSRGASAGR